jgi:arylsulfatase A-like enzyme
MRSHLRLLALLPAAVAAAVACGREPPQAQRPPNVVLYLVDTLRKDHLSVYGYGRETSPRLEEFARDAVRFETAYSPTSWTKPAVASLLTGVTPPRHRAISLSDSLDPGVRLLPQDLRSAGYRSAAFVTNPSVLPVWGFGRGFDEFVDLRGAEGSARADEINEAVFRYLAEDPAEPFFLFVHTVDPHYPYRAPPPFDASFSGPEPEKAGPGEAEPASRPRRDALVAAYDGEIRFADHEFGRLMAFLDERGLYRDALVVFTSDHGEELRDHGQFGHGFTLFEEVIQVPLLVKLPGNAHAGRVVSTPASLLDVLPTVVRLAGGDPPDGVEGVDLLDLLGGDDAPESARPIFLDLDLMGAKRHRSVASGVVLGPYKLLDLREPEARVRLFDLVRDPEEEEDAAPEEPELAAHLRSVIADHRSGSEAGVHLWVANANDRRPRRVEGSLRTTGRFEALRGRQLEPGDHVEVTAGGRRIDLSLELRNRRSPFPEVPLWFVDHDRVVFSVEPAGAPIAVESLAIDGAPAPVFLGSGRRPVSPESLVIDPGAAELRVERMDRLFPVGARSSSLAALGAYFGVVERTPAPSVVLDPSVEARLRALGYVD